jgi:hypothetical protein
MKRRATLPVLIALVMLGSCAGQPEVTDRTRVISVGFHSEDCAECEVLQGRMRRMNWRYAFAPIIFIKYDQTTDATRSASEERLRAVDMLEIARRDNGLRTVVLYDAQTRERISTITADDPVRTIRQKISSALER